VSSELTDSVKRYDAETGAYLGKYVSAGVDGQVKPRGLAFGPDGNLYVGGGGDGNPNVKRFDGETGALIDTVTSGYPPRINGLTFGPDGSLYGAVFEGDSVFRVDAATGTQLGEIGPGSPLDGPGGVAFGADGKLYGGSFNTGEVLRFDATTGAFIGVFATAPLGGAPNAVTFGPDGDLYVTVDYCGPAGCLSGDILRFDGTTGASMGSFIAPGDPRPVEPSSLVFAPDGDLYVSSHANDQVLRYDGTTGGFLGSVANGGGLDGPSGLVVVRATTIDLLVASRLNGRVIRYDGATGAPVGNFVLPSGGGLESPFGMTFGPDGKLYVANGVKPDGSPDLIGSQDRQGVVQQSYSGARDPCEG
jgi:outer membrane protein assembly factor BamB